MQRLLDATPEAPETTKGQRALFVVAAVVATSVILVAALMLGSWAYHFRLLTSHEGRLERLAAKKPTVELVTQALQNEDSPLLATPQTPDDLARAIATWGDKRGDEIRRKAVVAAETRVFRSGGVNYFLFFDKAGVLNDFVCTLQ